MSTICSLSTLTRVSLFLAFSLTIRLGKCNLLEPTLRSDWAMEASNCMGYPGAIFSHSKEKINQHYADIMEKTAMYRSCKNNVYSGMTGRWLEIGWIDEFTAKIEAAAGDVGSVFPGGVIPLFIRWVACYKHGSSTHGSKDFDATLNSTLQALIRPDMIYITVSIADVGLFPRIPNYALLFPNVFWFSAGGYGYAPVPMLPPVQMQPFSREMCGGVGERRCAYASSFMGHATGPTRKLFFNLMGRSLAKQYSSLCCDVRNNFKEIMANSKVSLCPRGFGRTSFRLYEAIQMGLIPVYIYDDLAWIPYRGTNASIEEFGLSVHISNLTTALQITMKWSPEEMSRRRDVLRSFLQSHYTTDGALHQIERYVRYGSEWSDITCNKLPARAK